jgi:hypothetical protein
MASHKSLHKHLAFLIQVGIAIFGSRHPCVHVVEIVLENIKPRLYGIGHGFHGSSGRRRTSRNFRTSRKRVPMNERVSGSATFDFP